MRIPLPMFQVRCIMLVLSRAEPFLCQRASESVAVLVWSCRPRISLSGPSALRPARRHKAQRSLFGIAWTRKLKLHETSA